MSITKMTQANFDALAPEVQAGLQAQGVEIIDAAKPVVNQAAQGNKGAIFQDGAKEPELELIPEEGEEESDDSKLWVNIYVMVGEKRMRLTASSLDSDFVKYTDKEHTNENKVRNAVVNTVEKHGISKAQEGIKFEVELVKQGESAIGDDVDLLA